MKRILSLAIGLSLLAVGAYAVNYTKTAWDIGDNGMSLYGRNTSRVEKQIIGINSSNQVAIDESGLGVTYGGAVSATGTSTVGTFQILTKSSSSARASTVNNGTITPVQTFQIIDTALDAEAVATVNTIATTNITIGTILVIETTLASRDIVLIETGNLDLGGTRTLSDPRDKLTLIKSATNQWDELSFVDNN